MRPRSFDRGNGGEHSGIAANSTGFNEAAIFRSRKRRGPKTSRPASARFNEAAIFRSRKHPVRRSAQRPESRFNEAAIFRSRKPDAVRFQDLRQFDASMRPRSFDRGNLVSPFVGATGVGGFNEAAIFRSRKRLGFQ